ncbi:hypothetical protein FHQ28_03950 [Pasteurellaceae bacterium USgator11]|nr:hypothetical protein FHQ20_11125 [Pasteurellaceae bacterium USgator41]TNG94008.1 hypothetical protein FHQ19_09640 [Pasteurellaceae bacterium UScroc12]TNH01562.1 hypothetical protein FHQ24_00760 [Pasteurellaceae bacterium UScroc31]TNH02253.1 hypothetical protein FHQ28_03950 [Pasteurellaceae bacterium USgator11]
MNKIYKVIWNKTTQTFVVVSELATSQNKAASSVDNVVIKQENRISAFLFKLKATMIASLVALLPMAASATLIITNNDNSGYAFNNNPANPANQLGGDRAFNYNNPGNLSYTNPNVARVGSNLYSPDEAVTGVAIGRNSNVVTTGGATVSGIAIGDYSRAVGGLAFALGGYSQATNVGATAIGTSALASGFNSLSMMRQAAATNDYAMAIGTVAWASGKGSLAMGQSSTATGNQSIAIGSADVSPSTAANGVSVASYDNTTNTKATADFAVAVGAQSKATAQSALAIGTKSTASAASATAISSNATASGGNSLALGVSSQAAATAAIAIGSGAQALGNSTVAIGNAAGVNAAPNTRYIHNVAVGTNAGQNVPGQYNVALGYQAGSNMTTGSDTVKDVVIIPQDNIAIGRGAGSNLSTREERTNDGQGGTYTIQNAALFNVAIGLNAGSDLSGSNNVALGRSAGSNVNGWQNTAVGNTAGMQVTGEGNTALGGASGNNVSGNSNVALGGNSGSTVTGNNNVALGGAGQRVTGNKNFSTGNGSGNDVIGNSNISMNGKGTITNGHNNVAIGEGAGGTLIGIESAPNSNNIAIGSGAGAASSRSVGSNIAIGYEAGKTVNGAEQTSAFTIALGQSTKVSGSDAVALALNAQANGAHAMALGTNTKATGDSAVALGMMANANGNNATALGRQANATVANALAVGYLATASATRTAALGYQAQATAANATSLGNEAKATAARAVAVGNTSTASGISSIAQGDAAIASGLNAVAIGKGAQATAENTISIGSDNVVSGKNSGALGDPSYISGAGTYTVGNDNGTQAAPIAADNAGAFGNGNLMGADADGSRIIGNQNNVQQANTFVVGNNVTTSQANSVILGNASADRAATAETSATINGITYGTFAGVGSAANGVVSVGAAGAERQIINVAAGQISATSTDAINGSQLYTVAEVAAKGWNIQANGGTSAKVAPGDTVNFINGTGTTATVATANGISNVSYSVNKSDLTVADNGTVSAQTGGDNFATAADVAEAINSANKTTVVEAGNNVTVNDPVVNGTVTTYTVNAEKTTVSAAADSGLSAVAGTTSASGVTDYAISLSQTSKESLAKADSALQTVVTQIDGETVKTLKQDDNTANFISGDNITLTADSGGIKVATKQDVTFNNVTANNLTAGPVSITNTGINAGNTVISNVASGGDVTSNAANIGDVKTAAAAAKSEVKAGTNVVSVDETQGNNGQAVYTVNAKGTTASAGSSAVTVGGVAAADNITDYKIDLSQTSKDSLVKADNALQSWTAQVNGADAKTVDQTNNSVNFVNGDNVVVSNENGDIKVSTAKEVTFDSVTINNGGSVTEGSKSAVNGGDVYTAIQNTESQFKGDNDTLIKRKPADVLSITGGATGETTANNIKTVGNADGSIAIELAKNLTGLSSIATETIKVGDTVEISKDGINAGNTAISNVASGGNVASNAANIGDVKTAAAAAKSEVKAGTNVVSVDESKGADNQTVYTVNAKGTTASAGSSAVTVEPDTSDVNNVTDYKVDLSEASKESLTKADTALQTVVTQIDGAEVKTLTKDSNSANFVTGDNIELTADNGGIKIATAKEVAFDKVSVGNTVINSDGLSINNGPSITSTGIDVAGNKISNVAAGENDTDAVNMSQLNQVAANQKVAKVIAGNNTKVTAEVDDNTTTYTVNAEKATVTGSTAIVATASDKGNDVTDYALDLTQATKDDIQKGVDAKETVDSKGLTFTGDTGSSDEKLLGSQIAVNGDENITTTADKNGVKVALNKDLTGLNSVSANTVNAGSVVVGDANNSTTLTGTANGLDVGGDKITNVAAGDVNENSTDAVNGSQLHTTNTNVANNTKNIAQNTAEIEKGINFGDGATSTQYQLGDTINVKGDSNVTSTTTADGVQLALAKNINLDSVTTGNTLLNNAGITINGGANSPVSLTNNGLNNGGNQITNVASGGNVDSNAANIGDVKNAAAAAKSEVAVGTNVSSVTTATGANDQTIYTVNADGASVSAANESAVSVVKAEKDSTTNITDYALDLTQATKDDIKKGVDAKSAVDSKGLTFSGDNGSTDEKLLGSKVAINGDDNITTTATADSVKIALNKNLTVDSVVAGNTTINTDGITITGGTNNVSLTNSGLNNGGNAITNVAAGVNDSDAVNVAQLKEVRTTAAAHSTVVAGDNVTVTTDTNADGGVEYNVAVPNAVVYDNDAHDSITLGGTSASEPVSLTNVKAGELNATSTDAVNGSQLHATNQNVAANSANIAQNTADIATNAANIVKGINFGDGNSSNNFALGATINVKGDNNIISTTTADGVQLGLANNITIGTAKPVTINGDSGTIGGLSNTSWNADNITSGQAATEDQLKAVSNIANQGFNLTSSASDGEVSGSSVEQVAPGETVTIDAGKNIAVTQNGNQISIATLNNLAVDSVVAGNSVLNNTGLTINDGTNGTVSLTNAGLNNGGNAITNVAAGVNDSDAVNVAQLNDVKKAAAAAATEITQGDNIVVTESKGKDGQTIYNVATAKDLNIDSVTAGDTVLNQNGVTVSDKVALNKDGLRVGDVSISTTGINAGGNKISGVAEGDISATSTDAVNGSQLYKIQQQAQAQSSVVAGDNIEVTTATNANGGVEYSVATAKVVSFDKTTVGTVVTDSNTNKISGLANGNISATSSDAVNGSQLYNNAKAVAATLGGGSAVDVNGNITAPTYTVTDGNPSSGNSVTVHTVGAAISNLTAGVQKPLTFETDSGSYVARLGSTIGIKGDGNNISTLADSNGNITVKMSDTPNFTSIKTGNTTVGNNGVTVTGGDNGTVSLTSNGLNNGGNRITNVAPGMEGTDAVNVNQLSAVSNTINNRINKVDNRASAGTASAMAAAGLPQAYLPGHSMVAVAGGTHRGENAMALGVSRISDNGKVIVKLTGATNSEKDTSASIGVGYQW